MRTTYRATIPFCLGLLAISAVVHSQNGSSQLGQVTVEIDGFESDRGMALVSLCADEDSFPPTRDEDVVARAIVEIRNRTAVAVFRDLPFGYYAVAVIHDADGNQQLNTNFLGMPTERYGFSNNARKRFRAPRFDEARFLLSDSEVFVGVTVE